MQADGIPIGFLVTTLVTGGAERQLQHLVMNLAPRFEPRIYTLRDPGSIGGELRAAGIKVESGLARGRFPAPWAPLALAARFRAAGVRAIYCLDHTNAVVLATMAAPFAGGPPVLVAVHTTGGQWDRPSIPLPVRLVLGRIERLLAVAEAQRRYLVEHERIDPRRIAVVRNGIPPLDPAQLPTKGEARLHLGIGPDEGPVVGILAMLRPEKAHENFLEAARLLVPDFPRAVFLIVGDGPRRPALEALADSLGLARQARFLGMRGDAPRILPALDLSVLASQPRVETLPLSQMEAMSLGIPVVATRVGALHELIEDGVEGYLVPPGDPRALAAAMRGFLADPAKRERAGRAARERILREFTIERVVRETEAILDQAIAGAGSPAPAAG